jgi:hypothetical protein
MAENCRMAEGHPLPAGWGVSRDTAIGLPGPIEVLAC